MTQHVQTKTEIREILDSLGVGPQKRLGQHFLIDGNLMRRLAAAAEIGSGDAVLEVGAGTGGLTDLLAATAGRVLAVELDRALARFLRKRFSDRPDVRIIATDVLANKNRIAPQVADALSELSNMTSGRLALVANLPYNVATPLVANLLQELPAVTRMCFTVQRDVAERIQAAPRSKAYGPLSIALQAVARIRRIARVPASAFWPAPKVDSTMLRLDVEPRPPLDDAELLGRFIRFVRRAFFHRRKTLKFNLSRCLSEAALAKAADLFNLTRR
ncbi:MAG: 16S rRNA (adenine(1518)-N(6)/adenine(1519)-N(6))-dimethyltransferase RsmA, partial [Planctomycetota bacterium]